MNMMFITNPWRINIKDKVILSRIKCCPAHWLPHKIPYITKPVDNEPCHFHERGWRMKHHIFYCRWIKCPHYKFMIKKYNRWLKKTKNARD